MDVIHKLGDYGLGKGAVGAGAVDDASLAEKLSKSSISDYLISVPAVSASCIDERVDRHGTRVQFAKTAGGPLGLAYALRLSGIERYVGMDELQLVDLVMDTLEARGIAQHFAVHDDDHDGCGCGACAKAHDVDNEIAANFEAIATTAKSLTSSAPDTVIQQQAVAMDTGFFAEDRMAPIRLAQDDGALVEDLVGEHDGQLIIINASNETTINSVTLRGQGIRAFVVDAWVFPYLASIFAKNDHEQKLVEQSQLAFNLATASVLCSKDILMLTVM